MRASREGRESYKARRTCEAAEEDAGGETKYYLEVSSLKMLNEIVKRQQAKGHNKLHP